MDGAPVDVETRPDASRRRRPMTRSLVFWIALLVTVLFSYLTVRNVKFDEVGEALGNSNL